VYAVISWGFGPGEAQQGNEWERPRNGPVESGGGVSEEKPNPQKLPRKGIDMFSLKKAEKVSEVNKSSLLEFLIFS